MSELAIDLPDVFGDLFVPALGKGGARKIPALMSILVEKGIDIKGLDVRANSQISFVMPSENIADGYDYDLGQQLTGVNSGTCRKRV